MSKLRVGLIYAYRDPTSFNWIYVGSVQNQLKLADRHNCHLRRRKSSFDSWLQLMDSKGIKVEPKIMQYVGYEAVSSLYLKENEWMRHLDTMWPKGLNKVLAGGVDRSEIARLGGLRNVELNGSNFGTHEGRSKGGKTGKGGVVGGRKNVESGHLATISRLGGLVSGRRVGLIQGRKNVESGHLASVASAGAIATCHKRWHVQRGIINQNCKLCREVK